MLQRPTHRHPPRRPHDPLSEAAAERRRRPASAIRPADDSLPPSPDRERAAERILVRIRPAGWRRSTSGWLVGPLPTPYSPRGCGAGRTTRSTPRMAAAGCSSLPGPFPTPGGDGAPSLDTGRGHGRASGRRPRRGGGRCGSRATSPPVRAQLGSASVCSSSRGEARLSRLRGWVPAILRTGSLPRPVNPTPGAARFGDRIPEPEGAINVATRERNHVRQRVVVALVHEQQVLEPVAVDVEMRQRGN